MKNFNAVQLSMQNDRVLILLGVIVLVLCLVSPPVLSDGGYTQGWLGAPDWVLDRMDTSILPDYYYPRNMTGEPEEIPTVFSLVNNGNLFLTSGSFNEAKKNFEEAIGLNSYSFDAWLGRGYALEGSKRYQSSLDSFEKAISLSEKKEYAWMAYAGVGRVSLKLGRYQAADYAFQKSIELIEMTISAKSEDMIDLYIGLAEAKYKLGEDAGAIVAMKKAEELNQG